GCPQHHRAPTAHADYWSQKIAGNIKRDQQTTEILENAGWRVMRFWEHEDLGAVADAIERMARPSGAARPVAESAESAASP
ncbi:MAG: very short patch repair endonuclease, partial [Actinomycetia bacterium]|nr:very short patch repair endonuclease [Actinomycetes bacterium]